MNAMGYPVHDRALAEILSQHRPIGTEEPLLPMSGPFAASPDGLSGWVQHAGTGRVCIYARAEIAPLSVCRHARQLHARGLITLRRCRNVKRNNLFDFMARRTDLRFADARPAPSEEILPPDARRLLELLVEFADAGRSCPKSESLAARIGVKSGGTVRAMLHRLKAANLIAVDYDSATGHHEIEILATGARTVSQ